MFRWPDVVGVLGFLSLTLLGGYLKLLPSESVISLCAAAGAYFTVRTLQLRRSVLQIRARDEREASGLPEPGESAVPERLDDHTSGVVTIEPQIGAHVHVNGHGRVTVTPDNEIDDALLIGGDTPNEGTPQHGSEGSDKEPKQ